MKNLLQTKQILHKYILHLQNKFNLLTNQVDYIVYIGEYRQFDLYVTCYIACSVSVVERVKCSNLKFVKTVNVVEGWYTGIQATTETKAFTRSLIFVVVLSVIFPDRPLQSPVSTSPETAWLYYISIIYIYIFLQILMKNHSERIILTSINSFIYIDIGRTSDSVTTLGS